MGKNGNLHYFYEEYEGASMGKNPALKKNEKQN